MAEETVHFIVLSGPDRGRDITLPSNEVRIGRSSNNDVVIHDPVMSRFHCRVYFKPGDGLWATDLGSSNQTLINNKPLQEQKVSIGDTLTMGDTTLKLVSDSPPSSSKKHDHSSLFSEPVLPQLVQPKLNLRSLFTGRIFYALVIALVLLVVVIYIFTTHDNTQQSGAGSTTSQGVQSVVPERVATQMFGLRYEKVSASPDNIMRYEMNLREGALSIQIDDIKNTRHVPSNQDKLVDDHLLSDLLKSIIDVGFFELNDEYLGVAKDVWDVWDLSVTAGTKTHRVKVVNRIAPSAFTAVCELLEEFGQNELGLSAIALAPEQLIEMAREACDLGKDLYEKREVKHENLFNAIQALEKAEWYIETVEPKPDFYADIVSLLSRAQDELNEVCEHQNFLANRAIKLGNWHEAAQELRIILAKIPNRSHQRYKDTEKRLIDVERRIR
ncbi:MAG: FHA domain-containing protein [Lentisphaerae bacterium]|nr:FHA domain-containing protein [Lentisphaerota bacterium]